MTREIIGKLDYFVREEPALGGSLTTQDIRLLARQNGNPWRISVGETSDIAPVLDARINPPMSPWPGNWFF